MTLRKTDLILTLNCVIITKWVSSLTLQAYLSFRKSVYSTHSVDQMKKQPKFDISLELSDFTIYSLTAFPFDKFLTDNVKTYGLIYLQ